MIGFDQSPRYAELIRRIFGEDAEVLPPGILLELDRPEWRIFKRELDWTTGQLTIAAAVGNFGRFQIQCPPGRIVVPTTVLTITAAGGGIQLTIDGPVATAPVANLALDTRLPFAAGPGAPQVGSLNAISNAAGGIGGYRIYQYQGLVNVMTRFDIPRPPIITPGHNLTVWDQTANEQLVGYVIGYERPAEPEELGP